MILEIRYFAFNIEVVEGHCLVDKKLYKSIKLRYRYGGGKFCNISRIHSIPPFDTPAVFLAA